MSDESNIEIYLLMDADMFRWIAHGINYYFRQ